MRKRNRIYAGILAGIIAFLLMFTYISTQVYRHSLPVVETADIMPGTVKRTYTMRGVLRYQSAQEITFPVPVIISKLYVEAGEMAAEGTAVLRLDTEYLEMERIKLEIELEEIIEREEREDRERQRRLLAFERKQKEEAVEELTKLLEAEGIIYSSYYGEVRVVNTKEDALEPAGKLLVSICDRNGGAEITWSMEEEGILFERFYAELRVTDGHNSLTNTAVLEEIEKRYDVGTNMVYYKAVVPDGKDMLFMHDEESLTVTAYYVSDVYSSLLPVSAVRFEADGTACVYELKTREKSFGTEYYVRKQTIHVSDRDNDYIATTSTFRDSRIIVNSSRNLTDRAIVWVEEESIKIP